MKNLDENNINITDLRGENLKFKKICFVLNLDLSYTYERAINNIIISKINQHLGKYYPENIKLISITTLLNFSSMLSSMERNNYNKEIFDDLFDKICFITNIKFKDSEMIKILFDRDIINWPYKSLKLKITYQMLIGNLVEVSINNKLYNKNLTEPFLILLESEINCSHKNDDLIPNNRLFILFGQYNFDKILKIKEVHGKILDCYFKILNKINSEVKNYSCRVFDVLRKLSMSVDLAQDSKISLDDKIYELYKNFYYVSSILKNKHEDEHGSKNMFLEEDKLLFEEEIGYNFLRFKSAKKRYHMFCYLPNYCIFPEADLSIGKVKNDIIYMIEIWLDYFITSINYKMVDVENCNKFLNFIEFINSPIILYKIQGTDLKKSLYEIFLKDALMSDLNLAKKFMTVLNFIFHPHNYYNIFEKNKDRSFTLEKLKEIILKTYDIKDYLIKSEDKDLNILNINFEFSDKTFFKNSLKNLISDKEYDSNLEEFLENYYFKSNKNLINNYLEDKSYEITHKNFIKNFENLGNFNLYFSHNQLNLFEDKFENNYIADVYKILMDLAKISHTIDENILKMSNEQEKSVIENAYLDKCRNIKKEETNEEKVSQQNEFKYLFGSIRNISEITSSEILNSNNYLEYLTKLVKLKTFSNNDKLTEIKRLRIDKVLDKIIKYYPIYPFYSLFTFSTTQNPEKLNCLIMENTIYKSTEVLDIQFENTIAYLKSQYDNILII